MADNDAREQNSLPDTLRRSLPGFQGEEDLMRALQAGDGEALRVIFERYHRLVLVTAIRILHDVGEAEDLMQSVFCEIFQKANQFDPSKGTLAKWILQYAYHRSINRKNYLALRRFYDTDNLFNSDGEEEIWITKVSGEAQESVVLVAELLAMLKREQREVLELVFFKTMTFQEIAEETKQTRENVRHYYYRGLKALRALLLRNANRRGKSAIQEQLGPANA
jgi:RNA polymerase sigma-70 factor (ECF subfamily)